MNMASRDSTSRTDGARRIPRSASHRSFFRRRCFGSIAWRARTRRSPVLSQGGNAVVPGEPLAIERMCATLDGIDLQIPIEAGFLARSAEQRQFHTKMRGSLRRCTEQPFKEARSRRVTADL